MLAEGGAGPLCSTAAPATSAQRVVRQNHPPPRRPGESEAHKRLRKKAGKSAVAWAAERHPPSLAPGGGARTALMQAVMIGDAKAMKNLLAGPGNENCTGLA